MQVFDNKFVWINSVKILPFICVLLALSYHIGLLHKKVAGWNNRFYKINCHWFQAVIFEKIMGEHLHSISSKWKISIFKYFNVSNILLINGWGGSLLKWKN